VDRGKQHGPRDRERDRERERDVAKPSRLRSSSAADEEEEEEDAYQCHSHNSHHSHHRHGGGGGGIGERGGGGGRAKGGQHGRLAGGEREGAKVSISPLPPGEYGFDPLTAGREGGVEGGEGREKRGGKEVEASVPKGPLGVLFKNHAALSTLSGIHVIYITYYIIYIHIYIS
jgi:hypothetical protein